MSLPPVLAVPHAPSSSYLPPTARAIPPAPLAARINRPLSPIVPYPRTTLCRPRDY